MKIMSKQTMPLFTHKNVEQTVCLLINYVTKIHWQCLVISAQNRANFHVLKANYEANSKEQKNSGLQPFVIYMQDVDVFLCGCPTFLCRRLKLSLRIKLNMGWLTYWSFFVLHSHETIFWMSLNTVIPTIVIFLTDSIYLSQGTWARAI